MYRILIVDDERDVVSLLRDYFEMNDYEVIPAYSGKEAMERISQNPDIILLDVNMPDGDGLSVCKKIRDYVSCPILFLTARIEDSDKINGFAAGGDDYILKPFSIGELGARVSAHIRRDHRANQQSNVRIFGGLAIDYTAKTVSARSVRIELARERIPDHRTALPELRAGFRQGTDL